MKSIEEIKWWCEHNIKTGIAKDEDYYQSILDIINIEKRKKNDMSKEEQYQKVAIELINQWIEDSLSIMFEYSGNFEKTKGEIRRQLLAWLEKVDSVYLYDSLLDEHYELKPSEY